MGLEFSVRYLACRNVQFPSCEHDRFAHQGVPMLRDRATDLKHRVNGHARDRGHGHDHDPGLVPAASSALVLSTSARLSRAVVSTSPLASA